MRKIAEGKKMGRPTDDPKTHNMRIRLSDTDIEKLEFCSKQLGKPKAEIIRMGIDRVYKSLSEK